MVPKLHPLNKQGDAMAEMLPANRMIAVQENLIAFKSAGDQQGPTAEYPIYSDRSLVGETNITQSPYQLHNAVFIEGQGRVGITAVLRLTSCLAYQGGTSTERSDVATYHGGWLPDEVAALSSLILGIRLKSGPANRIFNQIVDPRGRFTSSQAQPNISFFYDLEQPILSSVLTTPNLKLVDERLFLLDRLPASMVIALVRAARSYQDALWIAESEPNLAWLLFVSAIEIAASEHVVMRESDEENLREFMPELASLLDASGTDGLTAGAAQNLRHLYGSTRKFRSFLEQFIPPPPAIRPDETCWQVDWAPAAMKRTLNTIYGLRSKALHEGRPFPAPMCMPGSKGAGAARAEIAVTGLAVRTLGSSWIPTDAPMTLDTFHHIVRGALLAWWDHVLARPREGTQ